jgi:cobalt-zinc-cadmium resistance protein CzcA
MTGKIATIYHASGEVTQAIFFSATIIIAGFLPLFTLSGVEGHIFGPMAKTYAYALSGGLLATFTVSPALAALLLPEKVSETETIIVRGLRRLYRRVVVASCWRGAGLTVTAGLALMVAPAWRAARSGWSSCPSSRRATSGCARRCRPRCRSKRAMPTPTACAGWSKASPRSRP